MKKRHTLLSVISSALILLSAFLTMTGCSKSIKNNGENKKIKVVCTIFPEYDWAKTIIDDNLDKIDLSLIVKNGVDLHSFQPSTADVVEITTADIFIYVGGVSDNWVTDVLNNSKNPDMKVINLMEVIGDRAKIVEHDHKDKEGHHNHIAAPDEHVWLSIENAKLCVQAIANTLSQAAPDMASDFAKNCSDYLNQLNDLSTDFANTVNAAREKTLIFCDRFPFRYLVDDYGLNYYAAFTGCSAETEASFETIAFLSTKLQETGLNAVITIDNSDEKIAKTVIQNAKKPDCKILTLDSMQSTTLDDAENGKTYIATMTKNVSILKEALK